MATRGGIVNSLQRPDHQETTHPSLDDVTSLPGYVVLKTEHMKLGGKSVEALVEELEGENE